jgi:hypothetical protein
MYIVNEAKSSSYPIIIETIHTAFLKLKEFFRRLILTYQKKVNNGVTIQIPQEINNLINDFTTKYQTDMKRIIHTPNRNIDDQKDLVEKIKSDYDDMKHSIQNVSNVNDKMALIRANNIYTDMIECSKSISKILDDILFYKKKIAQADKLQKKNNESDDPQIKNDNLNNIIINESIISIENYNNAITILKIKLEIYQMILKYSRL